MTRQTIGPTARRVLKALNDGGKLTLERHYPYDRTYWCYKLGQLIPVRVTDTTIDELLTHGWIHVAHHDHYGDSGAYEITELGRLVLAGKEPKPEDTQEQLFPSSPVKL